MIYFEGIVWVLHQSLRCKKERGGCGASVATISPDFLKQLPTCLIDGFPFIATKSGIGIHQSMMDSLLVLVSMGISFGQFARSINKARYTRYTCSHLSYVDQISDIAVQGDLFC